MKKLKLRALDFEGAELLTKEQLKKILGGGVMGTDGPGTDPITEGGDGAYICICKNGQEAGVSDCGDHCTPYCENNGGVESCAWESA